MIATVLKEIKGLRTELHEEVTGLRQELRGEVSGQRKEFLQEFKGVHKEIKSVHAKLTEHDGRFDVLASQILQHEKQFGEVRKTLSSNGERLDGITAKLVDNTNRLDRIEDNMATKKDVDKLLIAIDGYAGKVNKVDQEQIVMGVRVQQNTRDIERIKPLVGI